MICLKSIFLQMIKTFGKPGMGEGVGSMLVALRKHFSLHSPIWEIVLHTLYMNLWFVNNEAKSPHEITWKWTHSFKWTIVFTRNTLSKTHYHCSCWLAQVQLTEINNLCYQRESERYQLWLTGKKLTEQGLELFVKTYNSYTTALENTAQT